MRIFLICPVRNVSEEENAKIRTYVEALEGCGHDVHWPPRDTNQNDPVGLKICEANRAAIEAADEVRVRYNPNSEGTVFDLAMAVALGKPVVVTNGREAIAVSNELLFVGMMAGLAQACKEIQIRWNPAARRESIALLGAAFALRKKIVLVNREAVKPTPHKSFENVLLALASTN